MWVIVETSCQVTKDEGGNYSCEDLHNGCELINKIQLWDYRKHKSCQLKTMRLFKRHYPGHWPDYELLTNCQAFELHDWHKG